MEITNKLFKVGDFRYFSSLYCETGSCYGQSIERAQAGGFPWIKSVEFHEPYYLHCLNKFKGQQVELFLGKSTDRLQEMLEGEGEAVIFLDAHPAGEGTNSHEEYIKGNTEFFQHNILMKELEIILNHRKDHLIIIDDQVIGPESQSYMDTLKAANRNYQFSFWNEQLSQNDPIAVNKILVCNPL